MELQIIVRSCIASCFSSPVNRREDRSAGAGIELTGPAAGAKSTSIEMFDRSTVKAAYLSIRVDLQAAHRTEIIASGLGSIERTYFNGVKA